MLKTAWSEFVKTVTLYTRVWIEIIDLKQSKESCQVTLYTRVWIEICNARCSIIALSGHPLHEGVDWNYHSTWFVIIVIRHPLHEGVDWNILRLGKWYKLLRSPSTRGCGLKFYFKSLIDSKTTVTLYTRVWIEIKLTGFRYPGTHTSPSTRGCGLK